MKPSIIGLIGLAGSGKDTAAIPLINNGYKRQAFADNIKYIAGMLGWDGAKDERGRKLLQDIGMAGRAYNEDVWVNCVQANSAFRFNQQIVITDVRFLNEAKFVKRNNGIVIRIVRPGLVTTNHESELKQSEVPADYEVANDGSIEDLHIKINNILEHATTSHPRP
jgi:dephospho-CoA kinase